MPSYRYLRDIKPEDLQDPAGPPRELSKKEKWNNWWRYHWHIVAIVAACVAILVYSIVSVVGNTKPDVRVALLTQEALPDDLTLKLGEALSAYVPDINEDGRHLVEIEQYTIPVLPSGSESEALPASSAPASDASAPMGNMEDPYQQMAGITKLSAAMQDGNPALLLICPEQVEDYARVYSIPGTLDGRPSGDDTAAETLRFGELAAVSGMDLDIEAYDGTIYSGVDLLADYQLGLVPLPGASRRHAEERTQTWQEAKSLLTALQSNTPDAG